jgi:branched-chain amino acid transport system permease protein
VSDALQSIFLGIGPAAIYCMLALGFVIVYKATGIVNFAYPVLLAFGAFEIAYLRVDTGLSFLPAVAIAVLAASVLGLVLERTLMRPMVGQPLFSAVMVTVGVFIAGDIVIDDLIGIVPRPIGDPWQSTYQVGGARLSEDSLWSFALAIVVVLLLLAFFRYSRIGTAMRATSFDQEAALAMGVPVGRVFAIAWAICGGLGALAGLMLASGGSTVTQTSGLVAFVALPVVILGGLDSIGGAVVGALIIGIVQGFVIVYQPQVAGLLGTDFLSVVPYLIMLLALLIRPHGLFGTPEIERV